MLGALSGDAEREKEVTMRAVVTRRSIEEK
jgi:hypothetical protein